MSASRQIDINVAAWRKGDFVSEYATRVLRPAEVVILVRYREVLSGRVLELGCGAGRLLGYLVAIGAQAHGVDVSPRMVEYCRATYPTADVRVGDLRDLTGWEAASLDCVFGSFNVLDILADADRRAVLAKLRELIAPGGLLVFSTHNLAHIEGDTAHAPSSPWSAAKKTMTKLVNQSPAWTFAAARRLPRRIRNRRQIGALERREDGYAILNDVANDYGLLHYYIDREHQEQQLRELGYELIECLDLDGNAVGPGEVSRSHELHYVARPAATNVRQDVVTSG